MAAQVAEIIQAHCSQCKDNQDAAVVAVVGDEIVTVTCKTCGTSQRYRPPVEARSRPASRRVVDVGSGGNDNPRPRGRTPRRVLSSTGREIVDEAPPRPPPPMPAPTPAPALVARPTGVGNNISDEDLAKRWKVLTEGVQSRQGRPHRSHEAYHEGEIVLHTAYGMGLVEQVGADGTLTVLFRRGYQNLPSQPKDVEPVAS